MGKDISPINAPAVPIIPVLCPEASRIYFTMCEVVVLPFVPVIPISVSFFDGSLNHIEETSANVITVSGTDITVTLLRISLSSFVITNELLIIIAEAPAFTASGMYECPSKE